MVPDETPLQADKKAAVIPVVCVQMAGSPRLVHTNLHDALHEVTELLQTMLADEAPPAPVIVTIGAMTEQEIADLGEFPGY